MRFAAIIGFVCASCVVTCFASELDEGIRLHERKDYRKAVSAFQSAAAKGNAEAQRRLGFMYYHGEGVPQDNARAVILFAKAAGAGDTQSAFNLAKMYEYGMGVDQDDRRAASWFVAGAELGDPESQFNASVMYYQGHGVAQDRTEAAKWWTIAILTGGNSAERFRLMVESAERKLPPGEIAEGQRRAADWIRAHDARK
jgi:hypothetical protein